MKEEYREMSADLLALAHGKAWSIESMEAHEAGGRSVDYIGSRTEGNIVYDYYRDSTGEFWFKNRAIVNGEIVSMEKYIFGHEVSKKTRARKWQKGNRQ